MVLKRIKALCEERKVSISALEKSLGFGSGTIFRWENSSPSVENLKKVADYFGVDINIFLEER